MTSPANSKYLLSLCCALLLSGLVAGCSDDAGDSGDPPDAMMEPDDDQDGYAASVDCRDDNRFIYPGATELCDGVDNNCNGDIDEGWDQDNDRWTVCLGDCRDSDPTSHPGAQETPDGADNDCDGIVDNNTIYSDDDGDGYSEDQGDCNDDITDLGQFINPAAVEVQLDSDGNPENVDNDCDGEVDEGLPACDVGGDPQDPWSYAHAFEACNFTTQTSWYDGANIDPNSRGIFQQFGDTYVPIMGPDFFVLSSGTAADESSPAFLYPQPGTLFTNTVAHPAPMGSIGCSAADPPAVNDYSEVTFRMEVPSNASAFSFDFNFMSAEFPEWVCSSYDDTFLAVLDSAAFDGNVSFDAMGNRVSINVGFFDVCQIGLAPGCTGSEPLFGTGYATDGGGTGWLTTTAPVIPGEKITLTFSIFDEGDHSLDSMVIIDNFRWEVDAVVCPNGNPPPCTIGRHEAPQSRFVYDTSTTSSRTGGNEPHRTTANP